MTTNPLKPEQLRATCSPERFDFDTTDTVETPEEAVGQPRALAALHFGIGIRRKGYHIFAIGDQGTGKQALIQRFLENSAAEEAVPSDICYVNNFDEQHKPGILILPAGTGRKLADSVKEAIEDVRNALQAAFESEDFQNRRQSLEKALQEKQQKAFEELKKRAEEQGMTLLRTPSGLVFAPVKEDGNVVPPDEVEKLSDEERSEFQEKGEKLQQEAQKIFQKVPKWQREAREKQKELTREITRYSVGPVISELRERFSENPAVGEYLDGMEKDLVDNAHMLFQQEGGGQQSEKGQGQAPRPAPGSAAASPAMRRYRVNVLVDNGAAEGAPVVYEENPTFQNLIGRVEHIAQMGALITDFNMIRPGSLHRANGGYLIIDALKIIRQPFAWEGLKRALRAGRIRIESPGQLYSMISTVSLEPEPVPLKLKVILLGPHWLYYLIRHHDPELGDLFKVSVDFAHRMERDDESETAYVRLIAGIIREEELLPFSREAVAGVIEQSARMTGDSRKLSIHKENLANLLRESDYWARESGNGDTAVSGADVRKAIDTRIYRSDRLRERIQEQIQREVLLIDTDGSRVGQVNGLSVMMLGDFAFGRPTRITARIRLGKGEVVDIEREVAMGGPIHSKGVLILSGFLGGRYALHHPLSLSASLVFEQSYSGMEGDSASSAELYALLSAISGLPLKQSLAVTGSVNQLGDIQPIGGVNQKIEGFFDTCRARGLTGDQGVLIPRANVQHLMLRADVIAAVSDNRFAIYPVATIDEGIAILTGNPAGEPDPDGNYPEGSVNRRVMEALAGMAERRKAFGSGPDADATAREAAHVH